MKSKRKGIIAVLICTCLVIIFALVLVSSLNNGIKTFERSIKIDMAYGKLYYPYKWYDKIDVRSDDNGIQFWANVDEHKEMHLFDINFDKEGYVVGTITTDSGKKVTVSIEAYEYNFDESWNNSEKKSIYAMSEDLNYVLDNLDRIEGYESTY